MALESGTRLGPYEIVDQIGAGGMGEVYKATDTRLGRTIAIKVLPENLATDPQRLSRFQREAQTISSLNHPHICALHDVGDENGTHFLVMEYVEGDALDQVLERGSVPLEKAIEYTKQIADALEKAHAQGIVHRDLKPANVMITTTGVKLLDFGLAKLTAEAEASSPLSQLNTQGDSELTAEGTIIGTLRYMAPEQVEGKEIDARTDIYALCLVVYEMITGRRAIDGTSQASLIAAIMKDRPQPLHEIQPVTPPQLDRVIQTGLEKDPEKRWQSAREMKHALEWVATDTTASGIAATPVPPVPAGAQSVWKSVAVGLGAVAVLALVYALWPASEPVRETLSFEVPIPQDANFVGLQGYLSLAPDGRKLAFTTMGQNAGIWVRDLDEVGARLLEGTEGAVGLFWSPDSQSIAYAVANVLYKVDIGGGAPQQVATSDWNVGSGDWSEDDVMIFGPRGPGPLQRVSAFGGEPEIVSTPDVGVVSHFMPTFLPGGNRFLFHRSGGPGNMGVYLGSLDLEPDQQGTDLIQSVEMGARWVPAENEAGGNLFFVRGRDLMAQQLDPDTGTLVGNAVLVASGISAAGSHAHFAASANGGVAYRLGDSTGSYELTWFDRSGVAQEVVGGAPISGESAQLALSPAGQRVAWRRLTGTTTDVWWLDLEQGNPARLTTDPLTDTSPTWWTEDRILFGSNRSGDIDIYLADLGDAAGSEDVLLSQPGNQGPMDVSPDGSHLLFGAQGSGAPDMYALPLDGPEATPIPVATTGFFEINAEFSPNGEWIAYQENSTGQMEIYVKPFPGTGGRSAPISSDNGVQPRWSPNGDTLFYVSIDTGTLMEVPVAWADSGPSFGAPVPLFDAATDQEGFTETARTSYAVGPDAERFLMFSSPVSGSATPITFISNWRPGGPQ